MHEDRKDKRKFFFDVIYFFKKKKNNHKRAYIFFLKKDTNYIKPFFFFFFLGNEDRDHRGRVAHRRGLPPASASAGRCEDTAIPRSL